MTVLFYHNAVNYVKLVTNVTRIIIISCDNFICSIFSPLTTEIMVRYIHIISSYLKKNTVFFITNPKGDALW